MRETVLFIHADGVHQVSLDEIHTVSQRLLSKEIVGVLFLDRLRESGPPNQRDKGGESE